MEYFFQVSSQAEHRAAILAGLREFNDANCPHFAQSRLPGGGRMPIEVVAKDQDGKIIGGVTGSMLWHWLFVDILWVDKSLRGSGLGTRLMERFEQEAIKQGCRYSKVGTYDFQALDFYEHLGYKVVGVYEDLPPGHSEYWLRKDFVTE